MTARELIGEFLLQGIKDNDLVEIDMGNKKIIKGYVVEKFVYNPDLLTDELKKDLYGIRSGNKNKLKIFQIETESETEQNLKGSMMINFGLAPKFPIDIYPEQIVSIKKI